VRTAHGLWTEREGLLLRVEDAGGHVGYGEVAPIPSFGTGTVDDAETQLRSLGDTLEAHWRARSELLGPVRFALAVAENSLRGNVPTAAREYWPIAGLLPAGRAGLAAVDSQLEAGFRTFKWKLGVSDLGDELVLLDDLLARLPDGARLRLDANGAWNRRQAERCLERCAERPIEFLEQPIAADARGAEDLLLGLANDYPTPIALDESLVTPGDLQRWTDLGWRGVWVVKLALLGAPEEVLVQLRTAKADVVFSSALETRSGAVATLQAAFGWAGPTRALGYGVWPLFADPRFDGPARAPFIRTVDLQPPGEELWTALS
jgi:o-succinylbenzoate synthase